MGNQSDLYFTTGEFANILGVKKHTLFHYDDIGLFSPAKKEPNGYRYYFVWQMDVFEVIRALQKLGMPLGEIKNYMKDRSPEKLLDLLAQKEAEIDQEIERLKNMKQFVRLEKADIKQGLDSPLDEPRIVLCPEEYMMISSVDGTEERKLAEEIAQHVKLQEKHYIGMSSVGAICSLTDLERGRYDNYVKVYTKMHKKIPDLKVVKRPAGTYVEVCYKGYGGSMKKPYLLIRRFAEENGLNLGELWYEDFLLDELTVTGYEEYVVKVTVAIL